MNNKITAAIYARVSAEEQTSLNQQIHICTEHLKNIAKLKGATISNILVFKEEAGTSGKNIKDRPEFQKMMSEIKSKSIDWVASKEISRLSRNITDFRYFMSECRKSKVSIFCDTLEIDFKSEDNPTTELIPNILSIFAELERKLISTRTSSSIRSLVKTESRIHGQPIILGFKRDPEKVGVWLPKDDEVIVINTLFNMYRRFKSLSVTVKEANKIGLRNKTGSSFTIESLKRLLKNRKYIAKMKIPGPKDEGEVNLPYPPIVPANIFDEVQSMLKDSEQHFKGKTRNPPRIYLLSGLLFTITGSEFKGTSAQNRNGNRYYYYRCRKEQITLSCDHIENAILKSVQHFCKKNGLKDYKDEVTNSTTSKMQAIKNSLEKISQEENRLKKHKAKAIDLIIENPLFKENIIQEIESRIKNYDEEILFLHKRREELFLEVQILEKTTNDLAKLENKVNTEENLETISGDRSTLRGWFRELFSKVILDINNLKIKVLWNTSITNGRTLLPFKVDLPINSQNPTVCDRIDPLNAEKTKSKIIELSTENKMTSKQIAQKLKISRSTVSKYLADTKSFHYKKGQNQLRKRGVPFGTKPTRKGTNLKIKAEQNIIGAIISWRESGKTFQEIADILNTQKVPTKTQKAHWCRKGIHQVWSRNIKKTD